MQDDIDRSKSNVVSKDSAILAKSSLKLAEGIKTFWKVFRLCVLN